MKNWNAKIWLAALALQLPPCVSLADATIDRAPSAGPLDRSWADDVSPAVGTLTLQWTISRRQDPVECAALGVERFVLSLNASPADEDQWEGPCDAFELSVDLPPGSYKGEAVLVDRLDRPITLAVSLEQIDIVAGRSLVKSVDFPVTAILGS